MPAAEIFSTRVELKEFKLAIETSGSPATIAIEFEDGARKMVALEGPRPDLGRELLPSIDALCKEYGAKPKGLSRVVVGLGPGTYTGLRIGIAAAKTLAFVSKSPIAGFPSTAAAAFAIFKNTANETNNEPRRVAVAIDALRGEFSFALYERAFDERGIAFPRECTAPRIVPASAMASLLIPGDWIATDRADLVRLAVDSLYSIAPSTPNALLLLELDGCGVASHADVAPLYLRASAAEEKAARANREI
ncbi:MAG: tRNA (adenosine(37)-N6)-threonylcarbamoyltransferase complex dimerization subunit type 1 TsaB [Planctomycetes bacterium]|nr:tRNA (adenosine(37)-N6)-threonylcarbamoyltransferase complex dimerization subunit type 1 TsaB [Planctomycetota bacterium]